LEKKKASGVLVFFAVKLPSLIYYSVHIQSKLLIPRWETIHHQIFKGSSPRFLHESLSDTERREPKIGKLLEVFLYQIAIACAKLQRSQLINSSWSIECTSGYFTYAMEKLHRFWFRWLKLDQTLIQIKRMKNVLSKLIKFSESPIFTRYRWQ
jgi:hypothetical protein